MAQTAAAAPRPGLPPAWPGRDVDVRGQRLFVRRAGTVDAAPAVLVHGLGGSSTNWTDLMVELAPLLDLHALDLPGFGRSAPPPDGKYSIGMHVRAVRRYIEHLDRGPVHLLGNSLGGAVSTRLAAEHPELVRTLALCSPALPQYRVRRQSDPRLGLMLIPGAAAVVARSMDRIAPEERARAVLEFCYADASRLHPQRVAEAAEEIGRRVGSAWAGSALVGSMRGLVASYIDPGPRNLWRAAARVECPTLLVFGKQDRLVPHTLAGRARTTFRDSRLLLLDDTGHVPQMEHPVVVADAVRTLIAGLEQPAT